MTNRGAVRPVGAHSRRGGSRLARTLVALLLATLTGLAVSLPGATAAPLAPLPVPAATTSPSATPSGQSPSGTPAATGRPTPRPDPEGDRWIELAVVGGGSLLGAVVMFMLIGGLIRWRNRRRYRN